MTKLSSRNYTRLEHLVLNLKGADWRRLRKAQRDAVVEDCLVYWRARGFPYYEVTDLEIIREYKSLQESRIDRILIDGEIQMSMVGVRLANYFHPQMWGVRTNGAHAPLDRFNDDQKLRLVIQRALTFWADRSSVNECNLRSMLRVFSNTTRVSNFRPTAAKSIFEMYSKDGDTVLDFSAGYGGRLLGCLPLNRHYIGIEPCRDQIRGLRKMVGKLNRLVQPKARVTIHKGCAEDILPTLPSASVPLVFSSPPYFNNERYSNEATQSYVRYPAYEDWLRCFLGKVLIESQRILKPAGYFVVNIADIERFKLTNDLVQLARKHFTLESELKLRLGHKPYLRNRTGEVHKHEPIFVFRKGRRK